MAETQAKSLPESRSLRLWLLAVVVPAIVIIGGLILKPELFYDEFIWKYFYGPIEADATTAERCITRDGVTACAGYTLVSEAGYAYVLLVAIFGVIRLLDYYDVGNSPSFFYGLLPYAFVGGAFRVVEDTGVLDWPISFFVISPVIYFTMFVITAVVFLISLQLMRRGVVDDYAKPLGAFGVAWFAIIMVFLTYFGYANNTLKIWVPVVVLGMATVLAGVIWLGVLKFVPKMTEGVGNIGAILLWGHLVDASATSIGIEVLNYGEKHPVVQAIINLSGTTYTFIPIKAAVILFFIYAVFDREFMEESPRTSYLFLVAILAVGLGPGTRDLIRIMIGV